MIQDLHTVRASSAAAALGNCCTTLVPRHVPCLVWLLLGTAYESWNLTSVCLMGRQKLQARLSCLTCIHTISTHTGVVKHTGTSLLRVCIGLALRVTMVQDGPHRATAVYDLLLPVGTASLRPLRQIARVRQSCIVVSKLRVGSPNLTCLAASPIARAAAARVLSHG